MRSAGQTPVALERSFFPALPGFLEEDLGGSLYALLATRYDLAPRTALEHLDPVIAASAEAAELGIEPGTPLMLIERHRLRGGRRPRWSTPRDLFPPRPGARLGAQRGLSAPAPPPGRTADH